MGMYIHLSGTGGKFDFSSLSWEMMLNLASEYGWEPAGTEPAPIYDARMEYSDGLEFSEPVGWGVDCYTEDYQRVTDEDAANIADALERALVDIPDFNTARKVAYFRQLDDLQTGFEGLQEESIEEWLTPVDFFSGKPKQVVRAFIEYCRAGGFCTDF
jgi:hypothetical protein